MQDTIKHPDKPFTFTAPYNAGDPMTDEMALALNTLKLDAAFKEAKSRGIAEIELEEFIAYQLVKAPLPIPMWTRTRTPREKQARKILVEAIKDKYKATGLTITGNLAAIESLANRIEIENKDAWKSALSAADNLLGSSEEKPDGK